MWPDSDEHLYPEKRFYWSIKYVCIIRMLSYTIFDLPLSKFDFTIKTLMWFRLCIKFVMKWYIKKLLALLNGRLKLRYFRSNHTLYNWRNIKAQKYINFLSSTWCAAWLYVPTRLRRSLDIRSYSNNCNLKWLKWLLKRLCFALPKNRNDKTE